LLADAYIKPGASKKMLQLSFMSIEILLIIHICGQDAMYAFDMVLQAPWLVLGCCVAVFALSV
jgi:hypothetical protein